MPACLLGWKEWQIDSWSQARQPAPHEAVEFPQLRRQRLYSKAQLTPPPPDCPTSGFYIAAARETLDACTEVP